MDAVEQRIRERLVNGRLPCPHAFQIADDLGISPGEVGREATRIGIKISRCQLGLFGYEDLGSKSIVKPMDAVPPQLGQAIESGRVDGKLPCRRAWEIAAKLGIGKVQVSGAAEALGIKISSCQLDCFS